MMYIERRPLQMIQNQLSGEITGRSMKAFQKLRGLAAEILGYLRQSGS